MARIFLSYKRNDYDKVVRIKNRIESALKVPCWFDLDGVESSQTFAVKICRAIDEADVFLFMYSKTHLNITDYDNDWTLRELNYAKGKNKKIVLVHIDDAKLEGVFYFMYSTLNNIDARNEVQFNKMLNDIRKWLNLSAISQSHTTRNVVREKKTIKQTDGEYVGEVLNGKRDGYGVKTYFEGDRYEGDWKDDIRTGHGVYTWADGDRYEGNWENNVISGYGIYYYAGGDKYEGNFENGKKSGQGVYTWNNGNRYEGNWENNVNSGYGIYYYADGDKYAGNFENGKKSGQGVYTWNNGIKYEGSFKNGKRDGYGTLYYKGGTNKTGYWKDDEYIGENPQ